MRSLVQFLTPISFVESQKVIDFAQCSSVGPASISAFQLLTFFTESYLLILDSKPFHGSLFKHLSHCSVNMVCAISLLFLIQSRQQLKVK